MLAGFENMKDKEEAQARLNPVAAEFPGPTLDAVLAALPRPAKRCLRATCTAGRAAVDARLTSLNVTNDQSLLPAAVLSAAPPRLSRLRRLQFRQVAVDEVIASLALLPATLAQLDLRMPLSLPHDAPLPQAQFDALIAAIAARGSLESLELTGFVLSTTTTALLTLGARLPALTEFGLSFTADNNNDELGEELPVLQLPWHQLQKLRLSGAAASLLPQVLAREAPALCALELGSDASLDVRALSSAPWFSQLTRLELDCRQGPARPAPLPAGEPADPAELVLQELQKKSLSSGFPLAAARRLAATAMPLRRLQLNRPAAGTVEAITGAPWASSLQALQLHRGADFETPAATATAAAALAAAPLGALTSLQVTDVALCAEAAPLSMLLAAPWAPGLRKLVLGAPFAFATFDTAAAAAAAASLAAAPLPALRVLRLEHLRFDAAVLSGALAAAPWLQRLEELELFTCIFSPEAFAALAAVDMPSLTQLDLASNFLSAPGLSALAAAPWLPRLQRLRLGGHVPAAARRSCLGELSKACSPFRALLARGGEIDTSRLMIFGPPDA